MKSVIFAILVVLVVPAFCFADEENEAERLSYELNSIQTLEKVLLELRAPAAKPKKDETQEAWEARAERVMKARAFLIHLLHQAMEGGLNRKYALEAYRAKAEHSQDTDNLLKDERVVGLEAKAQKLAKLAGVVKEGLEIWLKEEGLNRRIFISCFEDEKLTKAFKEYEGK